jgi:hypothetical protein
VRQRRRGRLRAYHLRERDRPDSHAGRLPRSPSGPVHRREQRPARLRRARVHTPQPGRRPGRSLPNGSRSRTGSNSPTKTTPNTVPPRLQATSWRCAGPPSAPELPPTARNCCASMRFSASRGTTGGKWSSSRSSTTCSMPR